MYVLEIGLFILGALLLFIGYRKTSRNLLLAAAIVWLLAGTASDFFSGISDGLNSRRSATQDSSGH